MKFFLDNKKKLVIAIVIVELLLLAINVFRFNRSESYLFSQDDFQVDYLNPETNRCVKDKINNGADYSLKKEEPGESAFVALRIILGIVGVGVIYIVYEFRREVWKLFGKVFRRFR